MKRWNKIKEQPATTIRATKPQKNKENKTKQNDMQIADNEVNKQSLHRILLSCQCNCQISNVIRNKTKIGSQKKNTNKIKNRRKTCWISPEKEYKNTSANSARPEGKLVWYFYRQFSLDIGYWIVDIEYCRTNRILSCPKWFIYVLLAITWKIERNHLLKVTKKMSLNKNKKKVN